MNAPIAGTDEAWDTGELGREEQSAALYKGEDFERTLDDASDLHPISIRLPKQLIESFKLIAQVKGGGMRYQTLMRQALRRFAECEMKLIVAEVAEQMERAKAEAVDEAPLQEEPLKRAA